MIEPGRVLQPIDEAEDELERLTEYETPDELGRAVSATFDAVERSLRRLVRADPGAAEDVRLSALSSADFPFPKLIETLRQRELISIALAGMVHELEQAKRRIATAAPRAADADTARQTVQRLRTEIHELADRPVRVAAHHAATASVLEDESRAVPPPRRSGRPPLVIIAGVVVLLALGGLVYWWSQGSEREMRQAVSAFSSGREDAAAQMFREIARKDADNTTARLYLARIHRRAGRLDEATTVLREAARIAPNDADVRRELGHLLMALGRPQPAIEQYRRAVDLDPAETTAWVGLVSAMRAAGDPRADVVLQRAPADARAALAR